MSMFVQAQNCTCPIANQEVEMLGEESSVSVKSVSVRDFSTRISITFLLYNSWYSKYLGGVMKFTPECFDSETVVILEYPNSLRFLAGQN